MSIRHTTIIILLSASIRISAQQPTIPIIIAPQSGTPVTLYGTVTAADSRPARFRYSYRVNTSATNVSDKGILLMITQVQVNREVSDDKLATTERSLTKIDDEFFNSSLFGPTATKTSDDFLAPLDGLPADSEAEPAAATAVAKVLFVQFADGSLWGDGKAAEGALRERGLALERLRLLQETYWTMGEQQFLAELLKPSQLVAVRSLQGIYLENKDAGAVIERLTLMLHNGELHLRGLR